VDPITLGRTYLERLAEEAGIDADELRIVLWEWIETQRVIGSRQSG
jgi:hypothetical protein